MNEEKLSENEIEECLSIIKDSVDSDISKPIITYIDALETKLEVCEDLVQIWRDSAGESGESAYSEVMECANELEKALRDD